MQDGSHSFRARSISLGADGKWSEYRHIYISQKVFLSPGEAILILVLGLLGAVLAIFGYLCVVRGYIARNRSAANPADQIGVELIDFNVDLHTVDAQPNDTEVEIPIPFVFTISEEEDVVEHFQDADDVNLIT